MALFGHRCLGIAAGFALSALLTTGAGAQDDTPAADASLGGAATVSAAEEDGSLGSGAALPPGRIYPWEVAPRVNGDRTVSLPGDPQLDLMLQQRRMLQEEIRVLEVELNNYPVQNERADLGYLRLQQSLEDLRDELAELDADIDARSPAASTRGENHDPGRRDGRRLLQMRLRDDLQAEADRLRSEIASLRPDQSPLAPIMQERLRDLERQIADLTSQIVPGGEVATPPRPRDDFSTRPGFGAGPDPRRFEQSLSARPRETGMMADTMFRVRLLRSAAEDLRAAGYPDIAARVDQEAAALLQFGGQGPGWNPVRPPSEPVPGAAVQPRDVTDVEPGVETPSSPLPSSDPGLDSMRDEIEQMRRDMRSLSEELQTLRNHMPGDEMPGESTAPPDDAP